MTLNKIFFQITSLLTITFFPLILFALEPGDILVTVNGRQITRGALQLFMLARNIPEDQQKSAQPQALKILVERSLMSSFLDSRKVKISSADMDAQLLRIKKLISSQGKDPEKQLAQLGFDENKLKKELQLPLSWRQYVRQLITDDQLRTYFKKHANKYDGTQLQAAHIFIKLEKSVSTDQLDAANERLDSLRKKIVQGELSFEQAARKYSESPSKQADGSVGLISYRGNMPETFSNAAFHLKEGEISKPVRTPFGLHLIHVKKRFAGEISLEDSRATVFNDLARELWNSIVAKQRKQAVIKWENRESK